MNSTNNNILLFPIYKTITGPGSGAVFDIVGWVGFKVTDYQANGSDGWSTAPSPRCSGREFSRPPATTPTTECDPSRSSNKQPLIREGK